MTKYIEFGGIVFGGESYIKKSVSDFELKYTPFIFSEFEPNEVTALSQKDDLLIDGSIYSNFRYDVRIVSLTGHILPRRGESVEQLRSYLITKINGKKQAKLIYFDGEKKYFCNAFGDIPVCAQKIKSSIEFNINFTVPDSFWYEYAETMIPVSQRVSNLTTQFTLPRIFTTRTSDAVITNENEFDIYPTVKITGGAVTASGSITVENVTTSETIVLSGYAVASGAVIVIDCKNLTATYNKYNIINYFNDFSDFKLVPGENHIKVYDNNNNSQIRVSVEFYRPYVGI